MPALARAASDRNLLFGILALQMDFISRDALIRAMQAWVLEKSKPLGQLLVEQEAMAAEHRALLEPLVQKHIEMHGGDAQKSLASVNSFGSARQQLEQISDADVQASLAHMSMHSLAGEDLWATRSPSVGTPTSSGLRFRVLRPHAKGGLGQVSVARDEELHREVALKEIQDRHADQPDSRARFLLEAEVTGGLEHPGIVPVYGLGAYPDGRPFYAMRFIKGDSLQNAIARFHKKDNEGSPSNDQMLALRHLLGRFIDVCDAIAYAHSRGVLHRDLKPGNIMLGPYGETLVVDWGLAKPMAARAECNANEATTEQTLRPMLSDSATPTQAGTALGTPAYMPPEQAAGRLDELGPASDVYSLGATLYCLLTGKAPFEGGDVGEILQRVKAGDFSRPRQVRRDVPAALEAVCLKAMALKPQDRYPIPRALAADVERWLADEPVSAYLEPWTARSRRWMRRHRALVSTAVGVLVIALLSTTVGLLLVSDAQRTEAVARKIAEDKEEEAQKQSEEAIRRREESRFNQYVAEMNLVQRDYEANNIDRVRELLEAQIPREAGASDFRGFEWYYWQRMAHRELLILKGHMSAVEDVSFSPDGRQLASASFDETVRVWDTATGKELLNLKGHTDGLFVVSYSPDGRRLASAGIDRTIRVWDIATGKELFALKENTPSIVGLSFSADGRRLASVRQDDTIRVWDLATGKEMFTLKIQGNVWRGVSFSPDGRRLAAASDYATVCVWDAATGKEILILEGHTDWVNRACFSPDGRRLASASDDQTVRVWDAVTGKEMLILKGHISSVLSVCFSPDGRRLASGSWDQTVRVWDAATGKETFILEGHIGRVWGVSFSPDGRRLASARTKETVSVWDAATGREILTLKGHRGVAVDRVCFSPDGRRLASKSDDFTVRLWDAATGKELLTHKGDTEGGMAVSFSPDSRRLASAMIDATVCVWDAATGKEILALKGHTDTVWDVCFSPDGRRLASASVDQTVRVWDAATGRELLTLKGHTDTVWDVSFSPDGRRLASASADGTVRVWDATTGQEILTLKGHTVGVFGVGFSPDGRRLASASGDQTVRVWDVHTGKELLTLKGLVGPATCVSFSPDGQTLVSANSYGKMFVWEALEVNDAIWRYRALVSEVHSLYNTLLFRDKVLAALLKDVTLDEAEREFAVEVANSHPEDPYQLDRAAWDVVKTRDAGKDAYIEALRCAEAAVRLDSIPSVFHNTLGVAQYRAGHYADALVTLTDSVEFLAGLHDPIPPDLAFLAMTQHQLGKKDEAKATLGRLRETMKQQRLLNFAESAAFLREAEELIEGKDASKKR